MTPFTCPEWLTKWASIHGIDWTRWNIYDAEHWYFVALSQPDDDGGLI